MSNYKTWEEVVEDFKNSYLDEDDARMILEEMSYEMSEEELERAEKQLEDLIADSDLDELEGMWEYDAIPPRHPEEDDYYQDGYNDSGWNQVDDGDYDE